MLPPEVNSGRMWGGPGSYSLHAAATAWDEMAANLYEAASSCGSTLANLTLSWRGESATRMASAAAHFVAWLMSSAAGAEQAAQHTRLFAEAYEIAHLMTVPLPAVLTNRLVCHVLTATNFFGQNTLLIMHHEAEYLRMWAQDSAAMYAYATASAAASRVKPFIAAVPTTRSGGLAGHFVARAVGAAHASGEALEDLARLHELAPAALDALASPQTSVNSSKVWTAVTDAVHALKKATSWSLLDAKIAAEPTIFSLSVMDGMNMGGIMERFATKALTKAAMGGAAAAAAHLAPIGPPVHPVSAVMGSANSIGKLTVPPSWAVKPSAILPDADILPMAAAADPDSGAPWLQMAMSSLAGTGVARAGAAPVARPRFVPRTPAGG
ncbi:putative PPE family protein PPE17 [Mycobacterium attenuatum]|uniref:Putative PPE family protein PPE17 n=2 Tax=Mycobacterium attenuatum TaxID=2341086 RepID=A0A498QFN7_9MYCO|nr:putative PPE family protein PPE17 [Mycobacterium attenuatum]VBA59527.1 putative PPE family protein PPE17 [Mycobacterium attenuatum]VBA61849.1 putative PPE family protein PPE17 [Mycobacterium attenuatum]